MRHWCIRPYYVPISGCRTESVTSLSEFYELEHNTNDDLSIAIIDIRNITISHCVSRTIIRIVPGNCHSL